MEVSWVSSSKAQINQNKILTKEEEEFKSRKIREFVEKAYCSI